MGWESDFSLDKSQVVDFDGKDGKYQRTEDTDVFYLGYRNKSKKI